VSAEGVATNEPIADALVLGVFVTTKSCLWSFEVCPWPRMLAGADCVEIFAALRG
jgi:hypothetical protein